MNIVNKLSNLFIGGNLLIGELLLGFLLAFLLLIGVFSDDKKFEDLALGTETVTYRAVDSRNHSIHLLHFDDGEWSDFITGWKARGKKNVILFLGNSQTHSINQRKENEVTFIELIHNRLTSLSTEALCVSFPNAGPQEFLLTYEYIRTQIPVTEVVIPVFFDDLREDGIRDVFFKELIQAKFQLNGEPGDSLSMKINAELRNFWTTNPNTHTSTENKDMAALKETVQEETERDLNAFLQLHFQAWQNRPNVRGDIFNWLYKLRNTILNIKASSIRRMIPQRYKWNMASLTQLADQCVADGVKVLFYVPPIRSDVPTPYNPTEYERFKLTLGQMSIEHPRDVKVKNYESIIPGPLWGYKAATNLTSEREVDYMHFQYEGHQILADSLIQALEK